MTKFVIFASPRTGSTSLAKVLGESPDVKMAIEPFHPHYSNWNPKEPNYQQIITDSTSMNHALDEIFAKYSAIKVLDYQFSKDIYETMLLRKDLKIIFLRRRNLLEGAISTAVAHQTSQWHKQDDQTIYDHLQPIDINEIKDWVTNVGEMNKTYESFLRKNRRSEYLEIFYEDLYSDNFDENKSRLIKICSFLSISLPPDGVIKKHMMPSEAKINYNNVYKKIPNYEELLTLPKE